MGMRRESHPPFFYLPDCLSAHNLRKARYLWNSYQPINTVLSTKSEVPAMIKKLLPILSVMVLWMLAS